MSDVLKLEIQTICISHIVAIVLTIIFIMMFYIKANKDISLNWFLVMQTSIILWMVFKIFKTVSPSEMIRWGFIVGYYFCTCIFEVSFLEFAYSYYKGTALSNKVRKLIYIFPILQFLIVITNPYHHLFYKTFTFWRDSFGILFYTHTLIVYSFVGVGAYYGVLTFRREFRNKELWYKYLIASTIVIPLIINFLFITKRLHKIIEIIGIPVVFDITPIVFTWTTLVFIYATFKHDFFSLSPILKHEIVHKLDTPICVLASDYEVLYGNEKFKDIFVNDIEAIVYDLINKLDIEKINVSKEIKKEVEVGDKYLSVFVREVFSLKETQYLLTIKDISSYKHVEREIKKKQIELTSSNLNLEKTINSLKESSKIGARNYVARELHDIIGHSLVVTIKLLEVAKLYIEKNKNLAMQSLENARISIETGIDSMKSISYSGDGDYSGKQLEIYISKLLVSVGRLGIKTNFKVKGVMYSIDEKVYNVIKKVCMELVTNSLKHSDANEVLVVLNIKTDGINMIIMDNGNGIKKLVKGNGLKGVEERLTEIGGMIKYNTQDGFMANISI